MFDSEFTNNFTIERGVMKAEKTGQIICSECIFADNQGLATILFYSQITQKTEQILDACTFEQNFALNAQEFWD